MPPVTSYIRRVGIGCSLGYGLYFWDKNYQCEVLQRSIRALYCGFAIAIDYKFIWTPENASQVHARVARRIVDCCKANEGLYVKFGQVLGSFQVAFPPEFHQPFTELQDRARTFDTAIIRELVSRDLPSEELSMLTDISEEPVASASVAQVHTALYHGRKVALKVQKPNIEVQTNFDLTVYLVILTALERLFGIPMVWSYDYTCQQLKEELDFRIEKENASRCREEINRNRFLRDVAYVPETFCASRNIIVAEWIDDAVKITDRRGLDAIGVDSRAVITDATRLFAYQIFGTGNVHCDPHPGNLLVRVKPKLGLGWLDWWGNSKPHQVVLIDHGLYAHLNPTLRNEYVQFWQAMLRQDVSRLEEICGRWGVRDSEMFSKMTRMQGRRGTAHIEKKTAADMPSPGSLLSVEDREARAVLLAQKQARLKERARLMLADTSRFPHELIFVNRCVNYIRATNWAHGSPIDRVAVFAETATRAAAGDTGCYGEFSLRATWAVWAMRCSLYLSMLFVPNKSTPFFT